MAFPSGQPMASYVLLQCQLQRWKSLQLDMEPGPVLCCAGLQIYYVLNVWTGGLTRPGISVWTCSASATLSVGSGGRSAVCRSYQKTLWCLHPGEKSRKSVHNSTQDKGTNSGEAADFLHNSLCHTIWAVNPAKFSPFSKKCQS